MPTSDEKANLPHQPTPRSAPRVSVDACPGALSLHTAADGMLARVRLPGGLLTPHQMLTLATCAKELGNGAMELTSRGNIQLRSISDPDELALRLAKSGLLPSATHERVRNVLASPLSGRVGGVVDIRPLIHGLDVALRDAVELSELPGRVLFSIDDGRGDVTPLHADFGVQATADHRFALILAGQDCRVRIAEESAVSVLLAAARAFLAIRSTEWRLSEIPDGVRRVLARIGETWPDADVGELTRAPENTPPIGWLEQRGGLVALGGGLEMGQISARLAEFIAAVDKPLVVTPWRTIVICDLEEGAAEEIVRVLAPMGLIFDASSAWVTASACTGLPGCDKSLADVRTDLRSAIEARMVPTDERQHWSGCERRCGRPHGTVTDVVATGTGYRVSDG